MRINERGCSNKLFELCFGSRQWQPGAQLLWHIGACKCPVQEERLKLGSLIGNKTVIFHLGMMLALSGVIFGCYNWAAGGVATGTWWVESWDAAKHTAKNRIVPLNKELSSPKCQQYQDQEILSWRSQWAPLMGDWENWHRPSLYEIMGLQGQEDNKYTFAMSYLRTHLDFLISLRQEHQNNTIKSDSGLGAEGDWVEATIKIFRQGGASK